MSFFTDQTNKPKLTREQSRVVSVLQDPASEFKRAWLASVGQIVLAVGLSVAAHAISFGESFSSLIRAVRDRSVYVWFIIGVIAFQSVLILMIWLLRKKNQEVITLKNYLIDTYVLALSRSNLNPKSESQF